LDSLVARIRPAMILCRFDRRNECPIYQVLTSAVPKI
jgi:hypothetical protein